MSKKKLLEFGLKEADAFQKNFKIILDRLIRGYKSVMGKDPEGLDLLKVRMEAREKALETTKVVNQKGLTLDPSKPIVGGTQEGIETIKTKFDLKETQDALLRKEMEELDKNMKFFDKELDKFNLTKDDPMGDLEKIIKGEGDTGLPKNYTRPFGDNIRDAYREAGRSKEDASEIIEALGSPGARKSYEIMEEVLGVRLYGDETFEELMKIKETGVHPRGEPPIKKADGGIISEIQNIIGAGLDKGSDIGRFILRAASGIPGVGLGIGALQSLGDKTFSNLPIGDQLFATEQMNIQGFDDQSGLAKDKYGYNIRSMFGNYADLVSKRAKLAADRRRKGLKQRAIDDYYTNLEKERIAAEEEAARRAATLTSQMATANRAAGRGGYQSDFAQDSGFMGGSGTAAEMGSFADGGLATMFVERR